MASTGEAWRLGRRPALDGLRGVAVLLVVVSHLTPATLLALGPSGVTMFFTLSGFLITRLLLEEHDRSGRIDLAAFYLRRLWRLAPAAVSCVAVVALLGLARPVVVVGALTYTANWLMAAQVGQTGALAHTWSLAIEEQFYLAWPLALIFLLRLRSSAMLVGALAVGIAASVLARVAEYGDGPYRIYYGTDTRADALLVGCLLAVLLDLPHLDAIRRGLSPWMFTPLVLLVGLAPLASAAYMLVTLPLVVALATAVAIRVREVKALTWPPLRRIGQRSYGLYLWHWPVLVIVHKAMAAPGFLTLAALVAPVSWALAELSWRFIERPFLRRQAVDFHRRDARDATRVQADGCRGVAGQPGPLIGVDRARG